MGWNDDRFYWEERRELIARGPGHVANLSGVVRKIEASRRLRRTFDYHRTVQDLLALDNAARAQGARLIVAVSRHGPEGLGDSLLAAVTKGLEGTPILVLDLGALGMANSLGADPRDPPGPAAHRAAAVELLRWLRKDILPAPSTARGFP